MPGQRTTAAALTLIGLVVAQSAVTVSGLWSTHLIVILPLPLIAIAAFAAMLDNRLAGTSCAAGPISAA